MSRIDTKIILIASIFAVSLTIFFIPLLNTILYFITDGQLDLPISSYLLRCYFSLLLAGFYAGFSTKKSAFVCGVLVGIVYSIALDLFSFFYIKSKFNWMSTTYGPIKYGIICGFRNSGFFHISQCIQQDSYRKNSDPSMILKITGHMIIELTCHLIVVVI